MSLLAGLTAHRSSFCCRSTRKRVTRSQLSSSRRMALTLSTAILMSNSRASWFMIATACKAQAGAV